MSNSGENQHENYMKKLLDSVGAAVVLGTFLLAFAYIGSVEAQTGPVPPGTPTAVAPPGGNLPVQPHSASTANNSLASTPSSGVVNQPTTANAPAANQNNTVNYQTGTAQYGTPNANSPQNATPASGQAPSQGATTNGAGQAVSAP
jgi:hypothetical protein